MSYSIHQQPPKQERVKRAMKLVSIFRIFIIVALLVSGAMELWFSAPPVEQIGWATMAGILAAFAAKAVHLV